MHLRNSLHWRCTVIFLAESRRLLGVTKLLLLPLRITRGNPESGDAAILTLGAVERVTTVKRA